MKPDADALLDLAARTLPTNVPLVELGASGAPPPHLAARRITRVAPDDVMPFLESAARDPLSGALADHPTRFAPLMPFLQALRGALREDGLAILRDLVWQTAPTPELLRAFAPASGREKVRPIEGYEMQIEHAGFAIRERTEVAREEWSRKLTAEQRSAVEGDTRGAARVVTWTLAPADDSDE